MTYEETTDWLFQQFPAYHLQGVIAYKPGLENVIELAALFDNPQDDLRFVHIAGTNGKGSVSNMLASVFTESGERTGLFTSPHICDFRERIRVNGDCIDQQFVIDFCEKVRNSTLKVFPSFFEISWMMALCYFREKQCSIVVAETGLGGRLDATNIVLPEISVITNIGLDHVNILGNDRKTIAFEKAGIIKHGIPVVCGQYDEEILPVFEAVSKERDASLTFSEPLSSYPPEIKGYQKENFDTVSAAVKILNNKGWRISDEAVQRGISKLRKNTGFFGRMEILGHSPLLILDCAHNAEGIEKLLESVEIARKSELHIVYGTSSDKDLAAIAKLLPADAYYYFTTFSNPRSATAEQLKESFAGSGREAHFFENPHAALLSAKKSANEADTILIFGSFFLAGDFFEDFSGKLLSN